MSAIDFEEAKACFAELIRRVESGEHITIMRDGKVAAHLSPPEPAENMTPEEGKAAVERFLEERAKWKPTGMTIDEVVALVREGRDH